MLVSITIPVYNDPEGLKKSLKSLIDQSYTNWEAIIIDDGSNVNLQNVINSLSDNRFIFYRFNANKGRPYARQKSFELLKGDYCAFLDAGDQFEKNFLLRTIEVFKNEPLLAVSQSMKITYKDLIYFSDYNEEIFSLDNTKFNKISFASTVFKSEVCAKYLFNKKLKYSQDKHFLNYVSSNFNGKIKLLNTFNYIYNQGNNMNPNTTYKKYYYDFLRIFDQKKYFNSFIALLKIPFYYMIHIFFGYEKILMLRYKK